jgi:hypothetical protein
MRPAVPADGQSFVEGLMKVIDADFNALTENGFVRLTTRGSQRSLAVACVRPGDWVWLTDGEIRVAAQVKADPRGQPIGTPAWDTLVDLDRL